MTKHTYDMQSIDGYLKRGDCRSAEEVWDILSKEQQEGTTTYSIDELTEKWIQIRQISKDLSLKIEQEIDRFLLDEDIDEKIAEFLLHRLERALLRKTSFKHGTVSSRVYSKIFQQRENTIYAEAEKMVRFHWDQAVALQTTTPTISPKVLLPYYTKALQEAKQQLSQYEKNDHYSEQLKDRLRELVEDAEKRRESLNVAEKSLTSGALIEDYVTTLEYIRNNPVDIKIQIFDEFGGSIIDVAPKEDAYKIYSVRALVLAQKKLVAYMEGGEGRLGMRQLLALGKPRDAEALHQHYLERFGLLETKFVPDITRLAERQDFFKFKAEIDSQLYVFEEIEREAQRISKEAVNVTTRSELISLWTEYLGNLRRYPLAEGSSIVVKDAYQALRRRFLAYLFTVADLIEVAIQAGEFDRAESIIKENNAVLVLTIVQGEDVVNRIQAYDQELDAIAFANREIDRILDDLSWRIAIDTTDNLKRSLRELEEYHPHLLKNHPNYARIVSEINSRVHIEADIVRLRGYLTASNQVIVESIARYAREKAKETKNLSYEAIATDLEIYLEFMKSGDLPLNERVVKLHQLVVSMIISDENLKSWIREALIEAEKQQSEQIGHDMSSDTPLKNSDYVELLKKLEQNADDLHKLASAIVKKITE